SVAIQNALVRTRSTYSRRTTAKVFFQFMGASFDDAVFDSGALDGVEVDLLELRFLLGERVDPVALQRALQELAAVGPGIQAHDERAVHGLYRGHAGQGADLLERGVHRDAQQVLRVAVLELLDRAL